MVFSIAARSAIGTLAILDRQAKRDMGKALQFAHSVYLFLSSPAAMATYRAIGRLLHICWLCIGLVFIVVQELVDQHIETITEPVQEAETQEVCEESIEVEEQSSTIVELASESEDQVLAEEESIEPESESETAVSETPALDYEAMGSIELRELCQRSGIKWRNAHGKGKHMSKPEMVAYLTAMAA